MSMSILEKARAAGIEPFAPSNGECFECGTGYRKNEAVRIDPAEFGYLCRPACPEPTEKVATAYSSNPFAPPPDDDRPSRFARPGQPRRQGFVKPTTGGQR